MTSAAFSPFGFNTTPSITFRPGAARDLGKAVAGRIGGKVLFVTGVIGFGGGSSLDVAKLTALLLGSNEELDDAWGVANAKGIREENLAKMAADALAIYRAAW